MRVLILAASIQCLFGRIYNSIELLDILLGGVVEPKIVRTQPIFQVIRDKIHENRSSIL